MLLSEETTGFALYNPAAQAVLRFAISGRLL
jgi:hypothetical protein